MKSEIEEQCTLCYEIGGKAIMEATNFIQLNRFDQASISIDNAFEVLNKILNILNHEESIREKRFREYLLALRGRLFIKKGKLALKQKRYLHAFHSLLEALKYLPEEEQFRSYVLLAKIHAQKHLMDETIIYSVKFLDSVVKKFGAVSQKFNGKDLKVIYSYLRAQGVCS